MIRRTRNEKPSHIMLSQASTRRDTVRRTRWDEHQPVSISS